MRIALVVFLIALVGALLTSLLFYNSTLIAERAATTQTLIQLGQTVQRTATIAAYLDNQEIATEVLQGLARNLIVAGVSLTSVTGLALQHGDIADASGRFEPARLRLESPFTPGETVGELLIAPRNDLIESNARAAAMERATSLAAYTLLVALIVMAVIQYLFVRALERVAADLHRLTPGSNERLQPPTRHANNEIGGLVNDINQLLGLVNEKLDSERALRQQVEGLERRFRLIYEGASVGICLADEHGRIVMANPAFREIVGATQYDEGTPETSCLHAFFEDADLANSMVNETLRTGHLTSADLRLASGAPGQPRWAHCLFTRAMAESDEGDPVFVQAIINDITERKQQEQMTRFQAEHDPLTNLHNRRSAERELTSLLTKARLDNCCVAVCLIDLDNFKPINDTYGHEAGDLVLVAVAGRMQKSLRQHDLAARLGGDEFLVALPGVASREDVAAAARKLMALLMADIDIGNGIMVRVGVSMGIALSKDHGPDLSRLMDFADQAMYQVKKRGKNNFHIYDASTS